MAEKRDYYEILGVEKGADEKAIKSAYRKLALKFHPDKNPAPDSAERFKEISAAYAILSDPEKRARYDQFGHAGIDSQYSQEDIFRGVDFSEIFGQAGGLGDIFSRIFGGSMGGFGGGYGGDPRQGRSIEHPYEISLEDAYSGQKAEIELRRLENCTTCEGSGSADGKVTSCKTCGGRGQVAQVSRTPFGVMQRVGLCPSCKGEGETITKPCTACHGEGRVPKTRRLQLTIPAGVDDGMRLRLSGEGEAGPRGGPAGDLYLTIHIRPHPRYERDGADLFAELPLSVPRAALGGRIPVPTLDGAVDVEIPAGVQSGKRLRLAGKGMPRVRGGGHGDLYLVTQVLTPERMTPKARELMAQLAEELGDAAPSGKKKTFVDRVVNAFKPD